MRQTDKMQEIGCTYTFGYRISSLTLYQSLHQRLISASPERTRKEIINRVTAPDSIDTTMSQNPRSSNLQLTQIPNDTLILPTKIFHSPDNNYARKTANNLLPTSPHIVINLTEYHSLLEKMEEARGSKTLFDAKYQYLQYATSS